MKQDTFKLAGGSFSDHYQVGDTFIVREYADTFTKGSVISLYEDDGSNTPLFKLVKGDTSFSCCNGEAGAYMGWMYLTPTETERHLNERYLQEQEGADTGAENNLNLNAFSNPYDPSVSLEDLVKFFDLCRKEYGNNLWVKNSDCKHITIHHDMRENCAMVKNRDGKQISGEELLRGLW